MTLPRVASSSYLRTAQAVRTEGFNYILPESRIATHPLPNRSSSKLLVVPRGKPPAHYAFSDLPSLLPRDSLVIVNSSKVIPARIPALKSTGGRAEILLLEPLNGKPPVALQSRTSGQLWRAFLGGRRIGVGDVLTAGDGNFTAEVVSRENQSAILRLDSSDDSSLSTLLSSFGRPPLPPYIKRQAETADVRDYQTVYANEEGSVAAPTAGLHVTDDVLDDLSTRGIRLREVVLHVGAGTFKPVESEDAGGHDMHEETVAIDNSIIKDLLAQKRAGLPIVAVGTTSMRTLESIYWFGVRLLLQRREPENFCVEQWDPYDFLDQVEFLPPVEDSLDAVVSWSVNRGDEITYGRTKLLIVPGYPFQMVNALVTNFHQPKSTLLMLVSAFHGGAPEDLIGIYEDAIRDDYRFLSYGDSSVYTDSTININ